MICRWLLRRVCGAWSDLFYGTQRTRRPFDFRYRRHF